MVAVIPIVAALKGASLRQQDYKDNCALFPHSFPGNLSTEIKTFLAVGAKYIEIKKTDY